MKKLLCTILAAALAVSTLSGCGVAENTQYSLENSTKAENKPENITDTSPINTPSQGISSENKTESIPNSSEEHKTSYSAYIGEWDCYDIFYMGDNVEFGWPLDGMIIEYIDKNTIKGKLLWSEDPSTDFECIAIDNIPDEIKQKGVFKSYKTIGDSGYFVYLKNNEIYVNLYDAYKAFKKVSSSAPQSKITNADEVLATLQNTSLMNSLTEAELNSYSGVPEFFVLDMNNDGKLEIFVMASMDIRVHNATANYLITFPGGTPTVTKFESDTFAGCDPSTKTFANASNYSGSEVIDIQRFNADGSVSQLSEIELFDRSLSSNDYGWAVAANGTTEIYPDWESGENALTAKMSAYNLQYSDIGYPLKPENFEKAINYGISIAEKYN